MGRVGCIQWVMVKVEVGCGRLGFIFPSSLLWTSHLSWLWSPCGLADGGRINDFTPSRSFPHRLYLEVGQAAQGLPKFNVRL